MLRNSLLGLMLILIVVGTVSAQSEWSGFYAGGNLGAALGRSTANTKTEFSSTGGYFAASSVESIEIIGRQRLRDNGFTGGLEAGLNVHTGSFVFGGELDYESLRLNGSESVTVPYTCCFGTSFTLDQSFKTNWLFTARPRAGFAMGPTLFYATGGLAVTKVEYQAQFSDTFAAASASLSEVSLKTCR
jgi:outer membrane immunogenic protein